MREGGARQRVLSADCVLDPGSDERALGGAVTVALCGHWEHEGECRWPHLTVTEAESGGIVHVRTTVTVGEDEVGEVRRRFRAALATGALAGPDGTVSSWRLVET
jgi:hypothetical protein